MQILIALMIVVLFGGGLLVLWIFVREMLQRWRLRRRLLCAEGKVINVIKKSMPIIGSTTRVHPTWRFFPVITFTPVGGDALTFTSETGDSGRTSRYRIGQTLSVRYDPTGEIPPMMDSWFDMWGPSVFGILAGLAMLFGSILIACTLGAHVFSP
jgi:hypothetical protein